MSSRSSSITGKREWPDSTTTGRMRAADSSRRTNTICARGTMMSRTCRSDTSSTPSSMVSASRRPRRARRHRAARSSSCSRSCGSAASPWVRRLSQRPVVLRSFAIGCASSSRYGFEKPSRRSTAISRRSMRRASRPARDRSQPGAACRARSGAPSARAAACPARGPRARSTARADHQLAERPRVARRRLRQRRRRERQHVGRLVPAAVARVERAGSRAAPTSATAELASAPARAQEPPPPSGRARRAGGAQARTAPQHVEPQGRRRLHGAPPCDSDEPPRGSVDPPRDS